MFFSHHLISPDVTAFFLLKETTFTQWNNKIGKINHCHCYFYYGLYESKRLPPTRSLSSSAFVDGQKLDGSFVHVSSLFMLLKSYKVNRVGVDFPCPGKIPVWKCLNHRFGALFIGNNLRQNYCAKKSIELFFLINEVDVTSIRLTAIN